MTSDALAEAEAETDRLLAALAKEVEHQRTVVRPARRSPVGLQHFVNRLSDAMDAERAAVGERDDAEARARAESVAP